MMISNLCLTLIDFCSIFGGIFGFVSFVILIVVLKRVNQKNTTNNNEGDFEKIQLLFQTQQQIDNNNNYSIKQSLNSNSKQIVNFFNNNMQGQIQAIQNVENSIKQLLRDTELRLGKIDDNLKSNMRILQEDNAKKLEQMRETVDEKLNSSLEKRLNSSFALISDRLEKVHKGLGEMQELATGVGDLKKVLTNVKTRGVWGEVGLGNILEQMLANNQFEKEFATKSGSSERVDYVILLPGKDDENIYLPIDAKFPLEDYQRLVDASEKANVAEIEKTKTALYRRIKDEAKSIREKYVNPPKTTDFAIMYLALEGLYAEIIRNNDLVQQLQRDYRIIVCGPTTLTALINSLLMGFKTVAIEKRSSEIWTLLATFKTEFVKFGDLLAKTQKKLDEASGTIEDATKKTKKIQNKLKNIGMLENQEQRTLLTDDSEE